MAEPTVTGALLADLMTAISDAGYEVPVHRTPAEAAEHTTRMFAAAAGLVNAFTGAAPFEGVTASTVSDLHDRLRKLSPVDDADEYRAVFGELIRAESARRNAWAVLEHVANPLRSVATVPRVRQVYEIGLGDLQHDATEHGRGVPAGAVLRVVLGDLPAFADRAAVGRAAFRFSDVAEFEVVGTGPGVRWFAEQLAVEIDREIAEQRRATSG